MLLDPLEVEKWCFSSLAQAPLLFSNIMVQMRPHRYKLGVNIHVDMRRETQYLLENQIRTLGLILGHFSLTTINAQTRYPTCWTDNFGLPHKIEMKIEK